LSETRQCPNLVFLLLQSDFFDRGGAVGFRHRRAGRRQSTTPNID
jgi:hypothetical protein